MTEALYVIVAVATQVAQGEGFNNIVNIETSKGSVFASSEDEAKRFALDFSKKTFPVSSGYLKHISFAVRVEDWKIEKAYKLLHPEG